MTDKPPGRSLVDRAKFLFRAQISIYEEALREFEDTRDRIAEGTLVPKSKLADAIAQLNKASQRMIEEIQKHDPAFDATGGDGGAAPLDFDALRDKIGRQLDRIRSAGGAGRVSGQSDDQ